MLGAMSLLAGCGSESDRTTKPIDDELQQEFVTSIQEVVQNQEEMGDVTWPKDVEDYHIVDKGDAYMIHPVNLRGKMKNMNLTSASK